VVTTPPGGVTGARLSDDTIAPREFLSEKGTPSTLLIRRYAKDHKMPNTKLDPMERNIKIAHNDLMLPNDGKPMLYLAS
jgi:hypothetical protein